MYSNNQPINIHINNENVFYFSCYKGHINIAQWLYELSIKNNKPLIFIQSNENAFRL